VDRWYQIRSPTDECYTEEWYNNVPKAIIGLIVYGAGIPISRLLIGYLYRSRQDDSIAILMFGSLFRPYRNHAW